MGSGGGWASRGTGARVQIGRRCDFVLEWSRQGPGEALAESGRFLQTPEELLPLYLGQER